MLSRAMGLQPGELGRAVPFFAIYLLLFAALTIADGASVSLFASRIRPTQLPMWYAITACLSLLAVGGYLWHATVQSGSRVFAWILTAVAGGWMVAWVAARVLGGTAPLGALFVLREIAMTMVLMHFGTFLQDYFLRSELNRLLPIIYAGGRVGGICGGGLLVWLAPRVGTLQLVLVAVALVVVAGLAIARTAARTAPRDEPSNEPLTELASEPSNELSSGRFNVPSQAPLVSAPSSADSPTAAERLGGRAGAVKRFLGEVHRCPLLWALTTTTVLFVGCRWVLAYQYTSFFESHFADDLALAAFLGRYTQLALAVSLVLQLFVVNRLVAWLGVAHTHTLYALFVLAGMAGNLALVGLPMAIASRFLETELRFGLRNPVNQMMVNRFSKAMRVVVRGWSLGWLIPLATLLSSGLIAAGHRWGGPPTVAWLGGLLALGFVGSALAAGRAYDRFVDRSAAGMPPCR